MPSRSLNGLFTAKTVDNSEKHYDLMKNCG